MTTIKDRKGKIRQFSQNNVECARLEKELNDLIEIIHFVEKVSIKIHGLLKEERIYETLEREFANSRNYSMSVLLLSDEGTKLKIRKTSLLPERLKKVEKFIGLKIKNYKIDLDKSTIYNQVIKEGKTIQVKVSDIIKELFPRPLAFLILKVTGYKKKKSILTPLFHEGKIIGAIAVSSPILADYFIPSVKSLAQHISSVLELVDEYTRREQLENLLRESEIKLKEIFLSSPEAITVTDLNAKIVDCNQATLNLHGFSSKNELIGKSAFMFIVKKDHPKAIKNMRKTLSQGLQKNKEYTFLTKNGHEFPAKLSANIIRKSSGEPIGFVAVTEDITERKKLDNAKTEFVSLASHQLKTPLTVIKWYTEMLLSKDIGEVNKKQSEYLDKVYQSSQRLVKLVNSLLNTSRIDLGTFLIKPIPMDITKIAKDILTEFSPQIKNKKLKTEINYDKTLPVIKVDPNLIRIIFENLISNSIKYTPQKGRIIVSIEKRNQNVLIQIRDDGYGIPKYQQKKIFQKLFRGDNIKDKDLEGAGLGLYIVKAIIDKSGGKIWFESEKNKGTTFYIMFPLEGMRKKKGLKNLN